MSKIGLLILIFVLCRLGMASGQMPAADSSAVVFINVNVWDGLSDSLVKNIQVVVVGNRIRQVGSGVTLPGGAKIIDGKGGTLIPGLSDAHVHLMFNRPMDQIYNALPMAYLAVGAAKSAENFLQQGFTTVRDMGGPVSGVKRAIDEGMIPGPRIYPSEALISQTCGHGDMRNPNEIDTHLSGNCASAFELLGWSYLADGRPEVLNAVRENLRHGASQIKMMAGGGIATNYDPLHTVQFTEDELKAGVEAASDWGTYVAVHVYHPEGIMRALNAGVKTIEHGHLINDTAMMMIRDKGAYLVPQSYWVLMSDSMSNHPAKFREAQEGAIHEMELAKKYGVKLGFGTDVFGYPGVEKDALKEFIARTQWFTPVEVLKQATSGNAEIFALSGRLNPYPEGPLGVIQEGAYADLLIYDGNPLEDLQLVVDYPAHLKLIMKDGKIYKNEL